MPQQMWKHTCRKDGSSYSMGSLVCSTCAGPGTYDGWHPRMHEAMALYQTRYRLKPIGPHRRMTDELFAAVRATCPACAGRGLMDTVGGRSWQVCSTCRGFGSYFTKPADEIEMLRSRVLAKYPDALSRRTKRTSSDSSYGAPFSMVLKFRTSDSGYFDKPVIASAPKRKAGPLASSSARSAAARAGSIEASLCVIFAAA